MPWSYNLHPSPTARWQWQWSRLPTPKKCHCGVCHLWWAASSLFSRSFVPSTFSPLAPKPHCWRPNVATSYFHVLVNRISAFWSIVFPFLAKALWVKLVEIPRWIKVSCPLTSACVNDQFLPRIGFHRAIYDKHCLRSRRHLAYCHFFASIVVVTYLALSRCQGRSSRHTSAIIKPLDKQTIKDFCTFMAIVSL